jgi:hypothetical protein
MDVASSKIWRLNTPTRVPTVPVGLLPGAGASAREVGTGCEVQLVCSGRVDRIDQPGEARERHAARKSRLPIAKCGRTVAGSWQFDEVRISPVPSNRTSHRTLTDRRGFP